VSFAAIAALCFALGILGGATMLFYRVTRRKNPPHGLAALHGTAILAGFVTLTMAVGGGAGGPALAALISFAFTGAGGVMLLASDLRGKLLPVTLILVHALLALTSFLFLTLHLLGQ
jgi:hypothetical protein